jgi:hypothetical protein
VFYKLSKTLPQKILASNKRALYSIKITKFCLPRRKRVGGNVKNKYKLHT